MNETTFIDKFAARLLLVCFFFPLGIQMWALIPVCIYYAVRSFNMKYRIPVNNLLWAFLIGSSYLLYALNMPFTPSAYTGELYSLCEHRFTFFLMPFAMAAISPYFLNVIKNELLYFVYACVVVCIIANASFIIHLLMMHEGPISHVLYRQYIEHTTELHPTYLAMYICFSICILMLVTKEENKISPYMEYISLYLLLLFLFSLLAKATFIALIVIYIHYIFTHRKNLRSQKPIFITLLSAILSVCLFVPFFWQRIAEVFQYSGIGKAGTAGNNSMYVRKLIWDTDAGLLKENWLTGVGPGKLQALLNARYDLYAASHNILPIYYDCHNEYLTQWLAFGIFGLLLFLFILLLHFRKALVSKNNLYLYLLIILAVVFFTETVLSRQKGVTFYAVFTSLFFFFPANKTKPG